MKLTNRQIVESIPSLAVLNGLKLPVRAAFKIAKVSKKLDECHQAYRDVLQKLQEEYGEKDEAGEFKVENDRLVFKDPEGFQKAFNELLEIENDHSIKTLKLDDLGEIEVEPKVLYSLDWLLEE